MLDTTEFSEVFQFPILSSLLQPSEAEEFDGKVGHNLRRANPGMRFRDVNETRELLGLRGQSDRIDFFGNNISIDDTLPNIAILNELRDTFGITAILQGQMKILADTKVRRPSIGIGSSLAWTSVTQSGVSLTYRLYSTTAGTLLWELAVVSRVDSNDDPDGLDLAVAKARREFLTTLLTTRLKNTV